MSSKDAKPKYFIYYGINGVELTDDKVLLHYASGEVVDAALVDMDNLIECYTNVIMAVAQYKARIQNVK